MPKDVTLTLVIPPELGDVGTVIATIRERVEKLEQSKSSPRPVVTARA